MKVKGSIVSQMSGRLGGLVAAAVKGGTQILRRRPNARQTASYAQSIVRSAVRLLSNKWGTSLSDSQRGGWNLYARNVTKLNGFGDAIHVSGNNWFVGNNVPRQQLNSALGGSLTLALDPPTAYDLGNPAGFTPDKASVVVNAGLGRGTITFTAGTFPMTTEPEDAVVLYASTPYGPGRAAPVGPSALVTYMKASSTLTGTGFALPAEFVPGGTLTQQDFTLRLTRGDGRLSSPFRLAASVIG